MRCASCGRVWISLEDCYFCVWWGSTVLAGVGADTIDPIIKKEMKRYDFTIQPTGKGNYYAVRSRSAEQEEEAASFEDLLREPRDFSLDF